MISRFRALSLALPLVLAIGCASTPAAVKDAKTLRVSYWDFKTDTQLALVNESDPAYADIYSHPRSNADIKRAPDAMMQQFVGFAGDNKFFDHAESVAGPNDTIRSTAYRMIVINADGKDYGFVLARGLGEKDRGAVQAFTDIQSEFLKLYNSVSGLQFMGTTDPTYFDKQKQKLEENAKRAQKPGNQ